MRAKPLIGALAFTVAVVGALAGNAQQSADPRVADLVQSGKLRVALGLGSPVLAMKDANTGQVRGPALDLAQALAKKIGVKLEPVEYPRPGAILAGVKSNEWDVTFLVADPARSAPTSQLHSCRAMLRIWYRLALRSASLQTWISRVPALRCHAGMHPTCV